MKKSKKTLRAKPKTEYKKCFKRWNECVAVDEEYFEEDNIDFDE